MCVLDRSSVDIGGSDMRPKSFVYVSKDIAVYLSQTNHSLAFKDGFKVHNIEDLVIGAEAYILLNEEFPSGYVYYISQKSIFGIVIMDHSKYYSIGGNNSEDSNDMRTGVH